MLQSVAPIRRVAVLAWACGLATVGTLALNGTARADGAEARLSCSNATLKGTYAFADRLVDLRAGPDHAGCQGRLRYLRRHRHRHRGVQRQQQRCTRRRPRNQHRDLLHKHKLHRHGCFQQRRREPRSLQYLFEPLREPVPPSRDRPRQRRRLHRNPCGKVKHGGGQGSTVGVGLAQKEFDLRDPEAPERRIGKRSRLSATASAPGPCGSCAI
jgi:hypothetical protein